MLGPKIASPAEQPRKRPALSCAASTSSPVRRLVSNCPPTLALDSRR